MMQVTWRRAVLAAAIFVAAVSASGTGHAQSGPNELLETTWKLARLGGTPVDSSSERAPYLVLQRAGHHVAGSGGCNRIAGGYRLDGAALHFDGMISTQMACERNMDQERTFLAALGRVAQWRIAGEELTLSDAGGQGLAVFRRAAP